MRSIKFSEQVVIQASAEAVFDYSQNYQHRLEWDTFLRKARLMGGALAAAKGVKAYCVAKNGLGMETEYVSFNRPKVTAITMTSGPYLFKIFSGSWTFKALNDQLTAVTFLYAFSLRFPFTLFSRFINHHLRRNVQQRLRDLKQCIERG